MNGFSDLDITKTDKDELSTIISQLKQMLLERAHDFMVSLISMISSNLLIPLSKGLASGNIPINQIED